MQRGPAPPMMLFISHALRDSLSAEMGNSPFLNNINNNSKLAFGFNNIEWNYVSVVLNEIKFLIF